MSHPQDLAVWSLYGRVQTIAEDHGGMNKAHILRELRDALAECEAKIVAANQHRLRWRDDLAGCFGALTAEEIEAVTAQRAMEAEL